MATFFDTVAHPFCGRDNPVAWFVIEHLEHLVSTFFSQNPYLECAERHKTHIFLPLVECVMDKTQVFLQ